MYLLEKRDSKKTEIVRKIKPYLTFLNVSQLEDRKQTYKLRKIATESRL